MNDTYSIIWVSKDCGRSGVGKKVLSREESESLADELNESHPNFLHKSFETTTSNADREISALKTRIITAASQSASLPGVGSFNAARETDDELLTLATECDPRLIDLSVLWPLRNAS